MSRLLVNQVAQEIRRVDGQNDLTAYELAWYLNEFLNEEGVLDTNLVVPFTVFLHQENPRKTLSAGQIADLLVEHYDLKLVKS